MSLDRRTEGSYTGPYKSIGWSIGIESKLRWRRGPQFGSRTVSYPEITDLEGNVHELPPQYSPWTWYNWRLRRVEGPEERFPPALTFTRDQKKTTAGIELEGRPDVITPHNT